VGEVIRDLGDGLLLRRAALADVDALVAFNARIHARPEDQDEVVAVTACVRDLATQPHPTVNVGDFTIVEDTKARSIVSSLVLISQTWTYASIPFGVGRVEFVGTHPHYRQRGLIRAQFEVVHRWSAERGEKVQAITGIPWFYRQFGYEMALSLSARRVGFRSQVARLKEGEAEPFRVRPAAEPDLPLVSELYEFGARRSLVSCVRDEAAWRYELSGRCAVNENRLELRIVETPNGEPVGFLVHWPGLRGPDIGLTRYELKPGFSWLTVTPSVVRYLQAVGEQSAAQKRKGEFGAYVFMLGPEHPAYEALGQRLPQVPRPYAWYIRVPDLVGFLRTVTPALEKRLAESSLAGHTGELKISFYCTGLRLVFEWGQLTTVESWAPSPTEWGHARFPGLTFLQLLFGYRSLDELQYAFADCGTNEEARLLVMTLFPKQASSVWALC
jgi:GNAT superfamily N-acetyltransferase